MLLLFKGVGVPIFPDISSRNGFISFFVNYVELFQWQKVVLHFLFVNPSYVIRRVLLR
jgi:hypothetical protein